MHLDIDIDIYICMGKACINIHYHYLVKGSLEVKLPTIWTDG